VHWPQGSAGSHHQCTTLGKLRSSGLGLPAPPKPRPHQRMLEFVWLTDFDRPCGQKYMGEKTDRPRRLDPRSAMASVLQRSSVCCKLLAAPGSGMTERSTKDKYLCFPKSQSASLCDHESIIAGIDTPSPCQRPVPTRLLIEVSPPPTKKLPQIYYRIRRGSTVPPSKHTLLGR
jgi:hypothetical protein